MTCIFASASLGYNRRLCSNAPIIDRKEIEVRKFSIVHLDTCCNFNFLLTCRECLGVHGKATCWQVAEVQQIVIYGCGM